MIFLFCLNYFIYKIQKNGLLLNFKNLQNVPCALAKGTGLMFGHVLFAVVIVLLNVVTEFHHLTASWMEWIYGILTDLLD